MPLVTDTLAFYHLPRTGGTWVRTVFEQLDIDYEIVGNQHDTPEACPVENRVSFTVMRDYRDWIQSWTNLVESEPEWSWPVPRWLLNATTEFGAAFAFRQYMNVDHILFLGTIRDDLQWLFGVVGIDKTVPDLEPVNVRNY